MPQREILDDRITEYLKDRIAEIIAEARPLWASYQPADGSTDMGKDVIVYTDLQDQLTYSPAVEIVFRNKTTNIFSIGTQEDLYEYDIICSVTNNHPNESIRYVSILANAIQVALNDFNHRAFTVPSYNFCVYYSEASNTETGYRRGKGLRSNRIPWSCKLLKQNRY